MPGIILRALLLALFLASVAVFIGAVYGPASGYLALPVLALLPLVFWLWAPRAAHRAFVRGDFERAYYWYRTLRVCTLSARSRAAIDVSLAACAAGAASFADGLALLERIDAQDLDSGARAAWLNNRAYALVRNGGDPEDALRLCEQAIAARPGVAGFHHTRGLALLACGRVDEAILELEQLWDHLAEHRAHDRALLESERCYDLGRAWLDKGDMAYALDYFHRAVQTAPDSYWAKHAASVIAPRWQPPPDPLLEPDGAGWSPTEPDEAG